MARAESTEQIAFMTRIAWLRPHLIDFVAAVPNGGLRPVTTAARLKCEGVRRGYPDIIVMLPRRGSHGLLIEMKRLRGGKVSDDQAALHALYRRQGYMVEVCAGAAEAWRTFISYVESPLWEMRNVKSLE